MAVRDAQIVGYLLGELPEDERETLERQFLRDAELRDLMRAVEDDLIDDYVQGDLPAHQRERFEAQYLSRSPRKERVERARALDRALAGRRAAPPAAESPPPARPRAWWFRPSTVPGLQAVPRYALAAAAVVVIAVGVWFAWNASPRAPQRAPDQMAGDQTPARPDEKPPQPVPPVRREGPSPPEPTVPRPPSIAAFTLVPGVVREAARGTTLAFPPSTDVVRLHLPLEPGDEFPSYRGELRGASDVPVWRSGAVRPGGDRTAQSVTLDLPPRLLVPGRYELTLTGLRGDAVEIVGYYYFSVGAR